MFIHDQSNGGTEKEIISEWILFFLSSLEILTKKLAVKYASYKESGNYINERQQQIPPYIETNQPVKLGDIAKSHPTVSIHTLKKDLQLLVQQQMISKAGEKKGTVYIKRIRAQGNYR